jgi:hypothetical protein
MIYNFLIAGNMYTQFYSNSRHDSYIDGIPSFEGKIGWVLDIPVNEEKEVSNRMIITDGEFYYIDALTEIIFVDADGKMKWSRPKWYGSQMVLNGGLIYYQSPERKDDMEAVDKNNILVVKEYPIDGVIDNSYLKLFQPDENGIIVQVTYVDIVDTSSPEYLLYRTEKDNLDYTWYKKYVNQICPGTPLVNYEKAFVLSFSKTEGNIFNLKGKSDESEADYTFKLPTDAKTIFASSSKTGDIFLTWSVESSVFLQCLSQSGEEKYKLQMENDFVGGMSVTMPPLLTSEGYIFILTGNKIFCIYNQEVIWNRAIAKSNFATVFADNSVIISAGNRIIQLDSRGEETFTFDAESEITAPVILNKLGGLIFCTKNAVYELE